MSVNELLASVMRWFQGEVASKDAAKDRLQLILIQDRASVDPGILEALREDIMAVMTSYFDVIDDALDVQFQREGTSMALVANIPIRTLRGRHDYHFPHRGRDYKAYEEDGEEDEPRGPAAMPADESFRPEEANEETYRADEPNEGSAAT